MENRRLIPYGGDRILYIPEALTDPKSFPVDETFSNLLMRILTPQRSEIKERVMQLLQEASEETDEFPWLFYGVPTSTATALHAISFYPENLSHLTLLETHGKNWFWNTGPQDLTKGSKGIAMLLSCSETAEIATRILMIASRMLSDPLPSPENKYHALYLLSSGKHHFEEQGFHISITFTESTKTRTALTSFNAHLSLFMCQKTAVPAEALGQIFTMRNLPNLQGATHPDDLTKKALEWDDVKSSLLNIAEYSLSVPLSDDNRLDDQRVSAIVEMLMGGLIRNANTVLPTLDI